MRLPTRVLLLIAPLVVGPILGIGVLAYLQMQRTIIAQAEANAGTLLAQMELRLRSVVQSASANASLFSESELLRRYLLTDDEEVRYALLLPSLLRQFGSYQAAYPEYLLLQIVSLEGEEEASSHRGPLPSAAGRRLAAPFHREMLGASEPFHHRFLRFPGGDMLVLAAGKQIRFKNPQLDPVLAPEDLHAFLVLLVDLTPLVDQEAHALGEHDRVFIIDHEGQVVGGHFAQDSTDVLEPVLLRSLIGGITDNVSERLTIGGEPMVLRATLLDEQLYLVAGRSLSAALAARHALGTGIVAITLLAVLVALAMLFGVLHNLLVKPLDELTLAAKAIGLGNLDTPISVKNRGEVGLLANTLRDMCRNLKESNEQVRYLAYHDSLTGLPNRRMFEESLRHALAHARRNQERLALLFLDMDDFKRVNDTLGHQAGDELLSRLATRISECLREEDLLSRSSIARLGGDEFLVLLNDLGSPYSAGKVAERIVTPFREPLKLRGHEFKITVSIGITVFPDDGNDSETLLRNADVAMYQAKRMGKNSFQFFSSDLNEAVLERVRIESHLRHALQLGELRLVFQPQVNMVDGTLTGLEALLRWHHRDLGEVSPDRFIPLAEDSGLIVAIGNWVIEAVCTQLESWRQRGLAPVPVSINVSAVQINHPGLAKTLQRNLENRSLDASLLFVEVTETGVMQASRQSLHNIEEIHRLGVGVALDDFGTGFSSLSHLRRFHIDQLKIDRSFVMDVATDADDAAIAAGTIALARSLGLDVIAEGVETAEQRDFLVSHGCTLGQGYLFGKPEPAECIETRLEPLNGLQGTNDR